MRDTYVYDDFLGLGFGLLQFVEFFRNGCDAYYLGNGEGVKRMGLAGKVTHHRENVWKRRWVEGHHLVIITCQSTR